MFEVGRNISAVTVHPDGEHFATSDSHGFW